MRIIRINFFNPRAIVFFSLLVALPAFAQEDYSARNVQIQVRFASAGFVRQGGTQSTQQSDQTQFVVVSDGLEGRIFIGRQVPRMIWFRDYLKHEGYLTSEVVFRDVGTGLLVRPRIVGNRIEVTLTPEISYETDDGNGAVALKRMSTTVVVSSGDTIEVGGGMERSLFESNFYTRETGEALRITLTPIILS